MKDAYPGLTIDGLTYAEWGQRVAPANRRRELMVWQAADKAWRDGKIGEWVTQARAQGVQAAYSEPGAAPAPTPAPAPPKGSTAVLVALGDRAFRGSLLAGRMAEPMLFDAAARAFDAAPAGSPVEVRAAIVCVCLCVPELRSLAVMLAPVASWEPLHLGGLLWGALSRAGADPAAAPAALRALAGG